VGVFFSLKNLFAFPAHTTDKHPQLDHPIPRPFSLSRSDILLHTLVRSRLVTTFPHYRATQTAFSLLCTKWLAKGFLTIKAL
jgi:hypothetical protein